MGCARVAILGAGVAGTRVANRLARSGREVSVTVVDSHPLHLYQPGLLQVSLGGLDLDALERPHRTTLDRRVRLVEEEVRAVDPELRTVALGSGTAMDYDFLVAATGCRPHVSGIPGFREGAFHFHCPKRAVHLRDALERFSGGSVVVGAARLPYKCPPSAHEFALLLDERLRRDGRRPNTSITFVYPLPRVYPTPELAGFFEGLLRDREVVIEVPFTVASVDPGRRRVRSTEGKELPYDLLVLVPPHGGAPYLETIAPAAGARWIPADRRTLRVRERVYALGDAADLPVPKSGAAAHYQAETVVRNLLAEAEGREPAAAYDGRVT